VTINVTPNEVIINVSSFIKHDGYTHRVESLLHVLFSIQNDLISKQIIFVLPDLEPVKLSNFHTVIEEIIENYNPTKPIIVNMIDHCPMIKIDGAVIKLQHSPWFNAAAFLSDRKLVLNNEAVVDFGAFFGRFSVNRMSLAYFLETNCIDNNIVGYQPDISWANFEVDPVKEYFDKELSWAAKRVDKKTSIASDFNGCVSAANAMYDYKNIFGKYRIEIVVETNTHDSGSFTEKTTKCLAAGKPFILFGTQGMLEKLKNMGFETFHPYINEDYDCDKNPLVRLEKIKKEILRINSATDTDEFYSAINSIAQRNKNNYKKIIENYYSTALDNISVA
jgi:hypothetical protein